MNDLTDNVRHDRKLSRQLRVQHEEIERVGAGMFQVSHRQRSVLFPHENNRRVGSDVAAHGERLRVLLEQGKWKVKQDCVFSAFKDLGESFGESQDFGESQS